MDELELLREENTCLKTLIREMFKETKGLLLSFMPENAPPEINTRVNEAVAGIDKAIADICPEDRSAIN